MVLLHGGSPRGAERIAACWADNRKVPQVVFKPDWTRHKNAAPFKRNDRMLEALPIGVVVFPGSGIAANLADEGEEARNPGVAFRPGRSRLKAPFSLRSRICDARSPRRTPPIDARPLPCSRGSIALAAFEDSRPSPPLRATTAHAPHSGPTSRAVWAEFSASRGSLRSARPSERRDPGSLIIARPGREDRPTFKVTY